MPIVTHPVTRQELLELYTTSYPLLAKAVVDLAQGIMAIDAEWHADLEILLLDGGSLQEDLWGVNLMLTEPPETFIAYESLINIRPAQRSFSTTIADPALRSRIRQVVDNLVDYGQGLSVREPAPAYGIEEAARSRVYERPVTTYPGFRHHRQLTIDKWRSFGPYKRVLMIANEFGRGAVCMPSGSNALWDCYERALELFQISVDAARVEERPRALIHGLLRLRERTAKLLSERVRDEAENARLRDEVVALEPEAVRLTQPAVLAGGGSGNG